MDSNVFSLLICLLILCGVAALEYRSLKASVAAYAAQGFVLALTLACGAAVSSVSHLYVWAVTLVISKGLIIPWIMLQYAKATGGMEAAEPRLGRVSGAVLLALIVWYLGGAGLNWVMQGIPSAAVPGGLAAAAALIALALYGLFTHRDTFKVAVAVGLLENGAHLFLACLAYTLPELISIGVVADVILAIWLLLLVGRGAEQSTGQRTDAVLDQVGREEVGRP